MQVAEIPLPGTPSSNLALAPEGIPKSQSKYLVGGRILIRSRTQPSAYRQAAVFAPNLWSTTARRRARSGGGGTAKGYVHVAIPPALNRGADYNGRGASREERAITGGEAAPRRWTLVIAAQAALLLISLGVISWLAKSRRIEETALAKESESVPNEFRELWYPFLNGPSDPWAEPAMPRLSVGPETGIMVLRSRQATLPDSFGIIIPRRRSPGGP